MKSSRPKSKKEKSMGWLVPVGFIGVIIILGFVKFVWPAFSPRVVKLASAGPPQTPKAFATETVVGGLNAPVAAAFAPDGRIFIAEKIGDVRVVLDGVLLATPVVKLSHINYQSDHGLLGLAVDPNFAQNGYLYISYTYENNSADPNGPKTGQIARLTVKDNIADPASLLPLVGTVTGDPSHPTCGSFATGTDCIFSDAGSHSVGGMRFGPDGKLYASLGDSARFDTADPNAQRVLDLDSLAGKILRINPDGTAPADNPFFTGDPRANRSKIYAYGVRNSLRFNFRPSNGALYLGDVGWYTTEEINLGKPGANYGWPCREGFGATPHYDCQVTNYTDPIMGVHNEHTATSTFALIGGAFSGTAYPPPFQDNYFFGIFGQSGIRRAVFDQNNKITLNQYEFVSGEKDWPTDFLTGPDGSIYYVSITKGELRRLTYNESRPPVVVASANPLSGAGPLEVNFTSASTTDPQGFGLKYLWDFGDGATSTELAPRHIFSKDGTYNATLTVTNDHDASSSAKLVIAVGQVKPASAAGSGALPRLVQITVLPSTGIVTGDIMSISAAINNDGANEPLLVDLEVRDSQGNIVGQQYFDRVKIEKGGQKIFSMGWVAQNPGDYTIVVGVYTAGWEKQKIWVGKAATIKVGSRSPEGA